MKNWFVEMEVFDNQQVNVVHEEPHVPKKEKRKEDLVLRDIYNTYVNKPFNVNPLGHKTIKSTKQDNLPKRENVHFRKNFRGEKYLKFEIEETVFKEPEDKEVPHESQWKNSDMRTLEEYYRTQQIPVDEQSLGKTSDFTITFTKTVDLSDQVQYHKRKSQRRKPKNNVIRLDEQNFPRLVI